MFYSRDKYNLFLSLKNPPENAGDAIDSDLIPGLGKSPEEGNHNSLKYSCLENPMDREFWQATVHGVAKSQVWLSNGHTYYHFYIHNRGQCRKQFKVYTSKRV